MEECPSEEVRQILTTEMSNILSALSLTIRNDETRTWMNRSVTLTMHEDETGKVPFYPIGVFLSSFREMLNDYRRESENPLVFNLQVSPSIQTKHKCDEEGLDMDLHNVLTWKISLDLAL